MSQSYSLLIGKLMLWCKLHVDKQALRRRTVIVRMVNIGLARDFIYVFFNTFMV